MIAISDIYTDRAQWFKALSDPNRLMIVDMLSHGELCACVILIKFKITQPTLSHHMRILCECGLVSARKKGKWTYYSLNGETVQEFRDFLDDITKEKQKYACVSAMCSDDNYGGGSCE